MLLNILLALLFTQHIAFASYVPTSVAIYSQQYNQDPFLIMDIIYCEGGFNEIKDSPTSDTGPMQVNSVHRSESSKMGLNLRVWDDNIHYGVFLMARDGLSPWNASKSCWEKHPVSGGNISVIGPNSP